MKKLLSLILALILSLFCLASCSIISGVITPPDSNNETYLYDDFASTEKALLNKYIGETIPFAPTNEYHFKGYSDAADFENGINYYTVGNSYDEYMNYRSMYSDYELSNVSTDEYGDTWYTYTKGDITAKMSYYQFNGDYVIDVYVSVAKEDNSGNNGNNNNPPDSGNTGDTGNSGNTETKYTYTSFTTEEKNIFKNFVGEVIPFAPNNEYYVEEDYDEYYEADCVCFYTLGNTQADFNSYRALFSAYKLVETFEDTDGDTWYCYEKGNIYIEMAFYYYEGDYVIDVYVYCYADDSSDSGNSGDNGNSGNTGSTNLPKGTNGVYDVDFTKADKVKDVTDQGYYIDGCPTTGSPAVLVIPVEFSDITAKSKNMSIADIERALLGDSDYYNLYDYYYISSGGKLTLDITILDSWFRPSKTSSYYENATIDYYGERMEGGDMLIIDEALDYLDDFMDLSKFDSDGNSVIDSIILVTTVSVGEDDFHWAYRYWNVYTDEDGYFFEYDGVSANDYIWMSCEFFYESTDASGNATYTDRSVSNPYTAIHEFGHVLGLDDYYDTSAAANDPMEGLDMMDAMTGDHNPFSKINLGWITTSRLVTDSVTLTLEKFEKNGDTIIIANNFDPALGAYQEYYIICYYTNEGLNAGEDYGFFLRDGIVVYHINASLYSESYDGEIYYDIANNNTNPSDEYGTEDNLIEFVKCEADTYTYVAGDKLPTVTDDNGNKLSFSFTVDSIDGDYATITFTPN